MVTLARRTTVLRALLAGIAGVLGSYGVAGSGPTFVVAPIESWLAEVMPGVVLRIAITVVTPIGDSFGIEHLGQTINLAAAIGLAVLLLGALALAAVLTGRVRGDSTTALSLALVLPAVAVLVVTVDVLSALGAGIGALLVVVIGEFAGSDALDAGSATDRSRRSVLGSLAGALAVGIGGYVLGERSSGTGSAAVAPQPLNETNATEGETNGTSETSVETSIDAMLAAADDRSLGVSNLEALVSGQDFYQVDINSIDPQVEAGDWSLSVTGAVTNPVEMEYADLTAMPADHRFMTLRCVSDPLNGSEMDTDLWTGIPVTDLLDRAGANGEYVRLTAADDYFQGFERGELEDAMIVYGKGPNTLPREHGAPARLIVPGHWGEIDVKWITGIEVLREPIEGFWEQRGWHGTGPANTVAKIHATNRLDEGRIQIAGQAYAGSRGVSAVEVSIDGGEWTDAELSEPLPPSANERARGLDHAEAAWRQWQLSYNAPSSEHTVRARAVEADGTIQPKEPAEPYPRGSMGWVSKTIEP